MVGVRSRLSLALLVLLAACGGGGGGGTTPVQPVTPKATGLAYLDPTGPGFRLVRQPESTASKLVLGLVGPVGSQGRGVAFTLTINPAQLDLVKVAPSDPEYVQATGALDLGTAPRIFKGLVQGGTLRATLAQKGPGQAKALDAPLAKIAIQFKASAGLDSGATLPITVSEGEVLPASGSPVSIAVETGSLRAQ